ncbi:unnamed protein product [Cuscuta campestris]|uniref:Uncharacterized protein n=1 Tax=Cuscuta campestris TaxID=132261 RepID=A0A484KBL1_9ASTE|nr:unnamed protein product [Cuscuta campestris]
MALAVKAFALFFSVILLVSRIPADAVVSDPARRLLGIRRAANRSPQSDCLEIRSRSQCSQRQDCRWCRSDVIDDLCFSRTEASRLPSQVSVCN